MELEIQEDDVNKENEIVEEITEKLRESIAKQRVLWNLRYKKMM